MPPNSVRNIPMIELRRVLEIRQTKASEVAARREALANELAVIDAEIASASRSFGTICSGVCVVRFIESLRDPTGVHRDSHSTWTRIWGGRSSPVPTLIT